MQLVFALFVQITFVMIDGDDSHPPERITGFAGLLGTYDVVLGSRIKGRIEEVP
jgi:hypothetical protein